MTISGRGPGQVAQFAKKAKKDKGKDKDSMRWQGVIDAVQWALGDRDKDTLDNQVTGLPDMEMIAKIAAKAKDGPSKDLENKYSYYKGVWECLGWIVDRAEEPVVEYPFW